MKRAATIMHKRQAVVWQRQARVHGSIASRSNDCAWGWVLFLGTIALVMVWAYWSVTG